MIEATESNCVLLGYDKFGHPLYKAIATPKDKEQWLKLYKMPDRVIPVVFLPGVMGSNLMSTDGKSVWKVDGTWSMKSWLVRGAEERKKLLDLTKTVVDPSGKIEPESPEERLLFSSRRERGWGEVGAMSYGTFLPWLQEALNDNQTMLTNKTSKNGSLTLRERLMDKPLGAEIGESNLTSDEVALSYQYLFPVHAVGYNWLQSNVDSAKMLAKRIEKIIGDYKASGRKCEKVILVTHSMGGLVARYYSELLDGDFGQKNILGIVHGVMPDRGAPMAYKRMKAGEAGPVGLVIGSSGAEMTPVLAQSPGPLQLLPGYGYGMGWFHVEGLKQSLPQTNPYTEIYTRRSVWWGLCEERLINPENKDMDKIRLEKDWQSYVDNIDNKVRKFIEGLNGRYHEHTYAFYGNDGKNYPSYAELHWKDVSGKHTPEAHRSLVSEQGEIFYPVDKFNQTIRYATLETSDQGYVTRKYELLPPVDDGDGTVPVRAAVINSPKLKAQLGVGVDHEGAYKPDNTMDARWFTLRSIIRIAQQVKNTGLAYHE
ncbi:esterase/lipase family protein [Enterobacter hormaechei]|uniref:esterase/lipase family protein n=1 Tax=Enterobacter hormaechei TaxID=158836 RepID=UPI0039C6A645